MKRNYIKYLITKIAFVFFMATFVINTYAVAGIEVNGELLDIPENDRPFLADDHFLGDSFLPIDHLFLPLRLIAESLGFIVEWDEQNQIVSLKISDFMAQVQIGSYEMLINGQTVLLNTPARLVNERTMMFWDDLGSAIDMDVVWNISVRTIHVLEPFAPIENWPEHLPKHVPGSIILHPTERHWSLPPMRFRHAFYDIPSTVVNLVDVSEYNAWEPFAILYSNEDINELMRFVQFFDISREDFDAAIESMRQSYIRWGYDLTDEQYELPNADIIFTFDNDLIRYFYRRE